MEPQSLLFVRFFTMCPPVTSLKAPWITTHLHYLLFESLVDSHDIDEELIVLIFLFQYFLLLKL